MNPWNLFQGFFFGLLVVDKGILLEDIIVIQFQLLL